MRALTPTEAFYIAACEPAAREHVGSLPLSYLQALYPLPNLTDRDITEIILNHSRTWSRQLMSAKTSKINQVSKMLRDIEAKNAALQLVLLKYNRTHLGFNSDTYRVGAFIHDDLRATYPTAHPRYIDETAHLLATGVYLYEVHRHNWAQAYLDDVLPHAEQAWLLTGKPHHV